MASSGPTAPVFVDPSGRRHRLVVRAAWLLSGLGAVYIGLVVLSLLLPPSLSRLSVPGLGPVLPGPGAAVLGDAQGEASRPEVLLARTPSPTPARSTRSPSPSPVTVVRSASPTPATRPTGAASPASTSASPTATTRPSTASTAAPTAPPGQGQPPGQASRSPRPRPTPSRGPR